MEWHVAGGQGRRPEGGREGGGGVGATEAGQQAAGAGQAGRLRRTGGRGQGTQAGEGSGENAHDGPLLLAGCQLPVALAGAPTGERLGRSVPSHSPFLTLLADNWPCPRGTKVVGLGTEEWAHGRVLTQAKRGQRLVCPLGGPRALTGVGP